MSQTPPSSDTEHPFIILTKRRTGGTSLTTLMSRVSRFATVQHEPFNKQRLWHPIVARFKESGDVAALGTDIDAILDARPNIKHCYEIIDRRVTRELVKRSKARGYKLFHLTRKDEVRRIRSLFVAKQTGVWGPDREDEVRAQLDAGARHLEPVDLDAVRRVYHSDRRADAWLRNILAVEGLECQDLVFETIYRRDGKLLDRALEVVASLGIDLPEDHPELAIFLKRDGQKTGELFNYLPNRDAFQAVLDDLRQGDAH